MRYREDKKCKKGQESTIGKIIYGFLLFMPLLAIGVTCLYAIFNKNAYKSYSGTTDSEYTQTLLTPSTTMFNIGETYVYRNQNISYSGTSNRLEIVPTGNEFKLGNATYTNINRLVWYKEGTSTNYFYYVDTTNHYTNLNSTMTDITFNVSQFNFTNDNFDNPMFDYFYSITYQGNYYVDNVFYYAIDKVEESSLFNWAENSIIYTTTNNTCNALNITTPFIPLLLAYWLIISVIYFLYDIALILVWIIHRKIHEMQESI